MSRFTNTLARVRVAAPCEADWDEMRGDERVRFCHLCSLNVYNLSAMTRREAERLVTRTEGRLCVRFYRRKDGTMLTQSCPVGLRALKRRVSRITSATFAAFLGFASGVGLAPRRQQREPVAPPVAVAPEEEYTVMAGGSSVDPVALTFVPLGILSGLSLLFVYPLMKFREWQGGEGREDLHIWRDS